MSATQLESSIESLQSAIVAIRQDRDQGRRLLDAVRAIAEWRSDAWDRAMTGSPAPAAGAYVWRRIAAPLVRVDWRTETRRRFAESILELAALVTKAQAGAPWPSKECEQMMLDALDVAEHWTVCKKGYRLRLDWAERSAEKALAALAEV
tara:strand:+ start:47 stop:496 length:450 start_codon:yes stop_codon:yes gene_type:complete